MVQAADKKTQILSIVLGILILCSFAVTFVRTMILKDYVVFTDPEEAPALDSANPE